jgi:hypothetical protein
LLSGYESKIIQALERHQAQLKTLQTERKAAYEKGVEQATQFVELPEAMEETYDRAKTSRPPHFILVGARSPIIDGSLFPRTKSSVRRERAAHLGAARIYRSEGKLPIRAQKPDSKTPSPRIIALPEVKFDQPATSHTKRVSYDRPPACRRGLRTEEPVW